MVLALAGIAHAGSLPASEEASVGAIASTAASAVPVGEEREFDEHAVDASKPAARVITRVVFIAPGSSSHRNCRGWRPVERRVEVAALADRGADTCRAGADRRVEVGELASGRARWAHGRVGSAVGGRG
jgi:hypothetical protein